MEEVREGELKVLGTCLGSAAARRAFLESNIATQVATLTRLPGLPNQHAFLLLSICLQQNLRHLQRSLKSDDISDAWRPLDDALLAAARRLRAAVNSPATDKDLISLPMRHGGLGLLLHEEVAPHAYAAAIQLSDKVLAPLLEIDPEGTEPILSQSDRCLVVFAKRHEELLGQLNPLERRTVVEAGTQLGRIWLSAIPFNPSQRLSDQEFSGGLHIRTLCRGQDANCHYCQVENSFGHDDVCDHRRSWRAARHEKVKHTLVNAIKSTKNNRIQLEPVVPNSIDRTDFRVTGSCAPGGGSHEFDLTIVSLATLQAGRIALATEESLPVEELDSFIDYVIPVLATNTAICIEKYLATVAAEKNTKYANRTATPFSPLVFSLGGAMDTGTLKIMEAWKKDMSGNTYGFMAKSISLTLLRARVKFFAF